MKKNIPLAFPALSLLLQGECLRIGGITYYMHSGKIRACPSKRERRDSRTDKEVKARGADVVGLTTESLAEEMKKTVDSVILVPDTHPMLLPSLDVVPMQLFAYYVALMRGCDIDKPRNLAKSVTVE